MIQTINFFILIPFLIFVFDHIEPFEWRPVKTSWQF
ncbi:hypothetical protein sync_0882 [Synechococcus sp. CC9311]|nr:hypothetical protein sync_0882 [Synechococcus sp. CC9311]